MTPEEIWERYGADAEWEVYDFVDPPYSKACNIYLSVDGYEFEGDGEICCGEKVINELWCTTLDGEEIKIM